MNASGHALRGDQVSPHSVLQLFTMQRACFQSCALIVNSPDRQRYNRLNQSYPDLPLSVVVDKEKRVDPEGDLWLSVLESTGQPFYMTAAPDKQLSRMSFDPGNSI